MAFNKAAIDAARSFVNTLGGHEADPWSVFPPIRVMSGETHIIRLLVPLSKTLDLWIHDWKGEFHTRTLCDAAHYQRDCAICKMPNRFGQKCFPKFFRLALVWDYSLIGASWTPKSGPNEGIPQPILPYGVISIPKGEEFTNWSALELANTHGYGFPDSPTPGMLWQVSYVPEVGFQPPQSVPEAVLGATPRQIDPNLLQWLAAASDDDIFAQYLATCNNVEWQLFGVAKPADHQRNWQASDQGAAGQGQSPASKPAGRRGGRGTTKAPQQAQTPAVPQAFGTPGGNPPGAYPAQTPGVGIAVPNQGIIQPQQQSLLLPGMPGYGLATPGQVPHQVPPGLVPPGFQAQVQQPPQQQVPQQQVQPQAAPGFAFPGQAPAQPDPMQDQVAPFPGGPSASNPVPQAPYVDPAQFQQQYQQHQQVQQPPQIQPQAAAFPGFPAFQKQPQQQAVDTNAQSAEAQARASASLAALGAEAQPNPQQVEVSAELGAVQSKAVEQQQQIPQVPQVPQFQAPAVTPPTPEELLRAQLAGAESQVQQQQQPFEPPQQPAQQQPPAPPEEVSRQAQIAALQAKLNQVQQQGGIPAAGADEYVPPKDGRRNLVTG